MKWFVYKEKWKSKFRYEFWSLYVFYFPFVIYWIYRAFQSISLFYFLKVNPDFRFGGFLDYSKFHILNQISESYKPRTIFIENKNDFKYSFSFPFIVKPDCGERGKLVELIRNESDWKKYPAIQNLIIQEYIDYPLEFGVFYAKLPYQNSGKILSITGKKFLKWESDGKRTLGEYVRNDYRAYRNSNYLHAKFYDLWNVVEEEGKVHLLEPIGNHNRGTQFTDHSHLITEELTAKINEIAQSIKNFNYGRFDVKTKSINHLQNGELIILELNGANSEPTHIYDASYNIWKAYREVKRHLDIQYLISKTQPKTFRNRDFINILYKRIFK